MKHEKIPFTKYTITIDNRSSLAPAKAFYPDIKNWYDTLEDAQKVCEELMSRPAAHGTPYRDFSCRVDTYNYYLMNGEIYGFGGKRHGMTMADFEK